MKSPHHRDGEYVYARMCAILVMEFLVVALDLIILIAFHQVEEKLLSENIMRDSIDELCFEWEC